MTTAKELYDSRYNEGYRENLSGYEVARFRALRHFLHNVAAVSDASQVLDYGCGSGLHADLWKDVFSDALLSCADISTVALARLGEKHPDLADRCYEIRDDSTSLDDEIFDVVLSVEVMEHVENLQGYLNEIHRLLVPGGVFVWTTPCANRLSVEHIYAVLTRQVDATEEGSRRWRWEDPTHVRRMRSQEVQEVLRSKGFGALQFRYRAHLFSFVCDRVCRLTSGIRVAGPATRSLTESLMLLDYALFRRLPNAASMIGMAKKIQELE